MKSYPNFPNKAHQRAYEDGVRAAQEGKARFSPYSADNRSSAYFRRAFLAGYDGAAEALTRSPTQ